MIRSNHFWDLPGGTTDDDAAPWDAASAAPASAAAAMTGGSSAGTPATVLYATGPGDTAAISANDIHQGAIGDCFLLSSIGELALQQPSFISSLIHQNSDGTEQVTLYEAANGRPATYGTTSFKAIGETVTNVFPAYGVNGSYSYSQDIVNGQKEIWPAVLEKAVAQLDAGLTSAGAGANLGAIYGSIAYGGNPTIAMEALTGHTAYATQAVSTVTAAQLQALFAQGDMIVMDTKSSGALPYGLVNSHAYMFDGITGTGSSATVKLLNPWGTVQPQAIPVAQLSKGVVEIDYAKA